MRAGGYSLGGEQSGHVIMLDHGTTGDGVLTGLMLAARMAATGRTLADLGDGDDPAAAGAGQRRGRRQGPGRRATRACSRRCAAEEAALDGAGRVLLRKSGTEPLVRVMVEAQTQEQADAVAARLAGVVRERLTL